MTYEDKPTLSVMLTDEFGYQRKFYADLNSSSLGDVIRAFVDALLGFSYGAPTIEDCLIGELQERFGFELENGPPISYSNLGVLTSFEEENDEEDDE